MLEFEKIYLLTRGVRDDAIIRFCLRCRQDQRLSIAELETDGTKLFVDVAYKATDLNFVSTFVLFQKHNFAEIVCWVVVEVFRQQFQEM